MSEKSNKSLFFIKSPDSKLTAIETYLKKRAYTVYIESDIKEALIKVIETQPDYILIALDHPNTKINTLPQILEQSVAVPIIAFVHSTAKEEIRKIEYSRFTYKLFPPMSGPAIERLISKIEKEKLKAEADLTTDEAERKKVVSTKSKDEMIQIKSRAVENFESMNSYMPDHSVDLEKTTKSGVIIQKGVRSVQLKTKNDFFSKAEKKAIAFEQVEHLKKEFNTRIKNDIVDVIETYQPEQTNLVAINPVQNKAYCLLIQSETWCGYLVAFSNVQLEIQLLEPVFRNWIEERFKDIDEDSHHDFFELEIETDSLKSWIENNSEYFEVMQINDAQLTLGFIAINPVELYIEFNEENDLIEVDLDLIPLDIDLSFSLHLHLPENKKFLLYTPINQKLSPHQKQRLAEKKVDKLYTPSEFASALRKMKIKKYLSALFQEIKSETLL